MKTKKIILLFSIVISINFNLSAWTSSNEGVCYTMDTLVQLSSDITYNTIDQMYEVDCNIVILENDTLRVLPGETLNILGHYYIRIEGLLSAIGDSNNTIRFGNPYFTFGNGNFWCGIQFINNLINNESIIKYCEIRGAVNICSWMLDAESAIFCENSSPTIDHCIFSFMASDQETGGGSAIACLGQSFPIVSYCKFEHLYNSVAIWCNPWYSYDTINNPSPLVFGCNILPSVTGFVYLPIENDVIIYKGGFIDNCYLGVNIYSADTTLGYPIDTIGDGILTTTSTFWKQRFMEVDGVVNPRGDTLLTGINEPGIEILPTTSQRLTLKNCYPNPFDNFTTIEFDLKKASSKVSLIVIDSKGNRIKTLINNQSCYSGLNKIKWYGDNNTGQKVSEGIYFYKLTTGNNLIVKKAIIVK